MRARAGGINFYGFFGFSLVGFSGSKEDSFVYSFS
jgi:hypothetical protein